MVDRITHVKHDEWRYSTSNSKSRLKAKRARNKAKRRAGKKLIDQTDN